ncbi:MAG: hypothetical protein K0Q53_88 [Massilibacillus sp.]|jgi:hypothetical protein|nr:hypothetical protein [Massilibacillus sp.]
MKIKQLIERLQAIKDKEQVVIVRDCEGYTEATEVDIDSEGQVYIE